MNDVKKISFKIFVLVFLVVLTILGCHIDKKKPIKNTSIKIPQKIEVPVDSLSGNALKEMGLDNFRSVEDTIIFTSPSPFLYFPFGKFKEETGIIRDYPKLKFTREVYSNDIDSVELYKYRDKSNFIKMIKNDESGLFDVVFAKLLSHEVMLKNGEGVGSIKLAIFEFGIIAPILLLQNV